MPAPAGKDGSIAISGSFYVDNTKAWSLNITQGELDVTSFDTGDWKDFIPDKNLAFDGTYDGLLDSATVLTAPTTGTLSFTLLATSGTPSFVGDGFITSCNITTDINSEITVSYTFRGTGTLTIA